jgi:ADP-dependent phosphofructokinase/glucokinase
VNEELLIKSITRIRIEPGEILAVQVRQDQFQKDAIDSLERIFKQYGIDRVFYHTQDLGFAAIKDQESK